MIPKDIKFSLNEYYKYCDALKMRDLEKRERFGRILCTLWLFSSFIVCLLLIFFAILNLFISISPKIKLFFLAISLTPYSFGLLPLLLEVSWLDNYIDKKYQSHRIIKKLFEELIRIDRILKELEEEFKVNEYITLKLEHQELWLSLFSPLYPSLETILSLKPSDSNIKLEMPPSPSIEKIRKHLQTQIYVDGERFMQCKYLLLNIPVDAQEKTFNYDSIDDLALAYNTQHEMNSSIIDSETEFRGHCSNLQVWAENNYDTKLLDMKLAFPLLKELVTAGDPIAKRMYKEEVAKRLQSGSINVIRYLVLENNLDIFTKEELETIYQPLNQDALRIIKDNIEKKK